MSPTQRTIGDWETEADSESALDAALEKSGLFRVYREVWGEMMHPRPTQEDKRVRIDRILLPKEGLRNLGWEHGAVGIEVKRSGIKVGQPIAQAMDYSRSVWRLSGGVRVWLDFVFIWPMDPQVGPVASILAQNRIGSAHSTRFVTLQLKCGSHNTLKVGRDGDVKIGKAVHGTKSGSR